MLPRERHVFFTRKKQQQNNQVHGPAISFSLLASVYLYTLVLTYDLPVFDTLVFTSLHVDACVWIYLYMYVCMCVCVYRYMYVHVSSVYIPMSVSMCIFRPILVCIHNTYVYPCIHIYSRGSRRQGGPQPS